MMSDENKIANLLGVMHRLTQIDTRFWNNPHRRKEQLCQLHQPSWMPTVLDPR
jgi:hypothetical protein